MSRGHKCNPPIPNISGVQSHMTKLAYNAESSSSSSSSYYLSRFWKRHGGEVYWRVRELRKD